MFWILEIIYIAECYEKRKDHQNKILTKILPIYFNVSLAILSSGQEVKIINQGIWASNTAFRFSFIMQFILNLGYKLCPLQYEMDHGV